MTKSLRERVTQISIFAFVAASVVALTCFVLFSLTKRNLSQSEVERELRINSQAQIEQLLPSFLLPEQIAGLDSLLKRFKDAEALTHAESIALPSQLPVAFRHCELNPKSPSACLSADGKETAVIFPIAEGSRHFGYLMKAKLNTSSWAMKDIFQLVGIFALMLVATFVTVYVFIARILSRKLPRALDRLAQWIEDDLGDRPNNIEPLPFRELEDLKEKISEIMQRHNQARDQAIVGQVTSGIMHDINTPLSSIYAASHLLERAPESGEKRLRFLENLATVCRENLPVVKNIVETTLDGSRQISLNIRRTDLVASVKDAISLNQSSALLHKVSVNLESPTKLECDHDCTQIIRVVHNLVKNAIEAAAEANEMRIVNLKVSEADETNIDILVEDTGPGIAASPSRIFRAFKSSKIRGSGLGLVISKKIIESHGGKIRADRSPSFGGARFSVSIPRNHLESIL